MEALFIWDDAKAAANFRKHGVSFDEAQEVFADPFHLVLDNYLIDGEQRMMAVGMAGKVMLIALIFVDRSVPPIDIYHFISARKATAYEQTLYRTQG